MVRDIKDAFPPPDELLQLEPKEIAVFLLDYLCDSDEGKKGHLNRYNFTLADRFTSYVSDDTKRKQVLNVIMEAWMWLEREGMLAPQPGHQGEWVFITRKGYRLRDRANLDAYRKGHFLPRESLDENLIRNVYPLFIKGSYDTAVFQAYKEVEVRVRAKAGLSDSDYGIALMRKAFNENNGPLTDTESVISERQAMRDLFVGSIGLFKNPSSHREVNYNDPGEAAELILFANYLLRLVERTPSTNKVETKI